VPVIGLGASAPAYYGAVGDRLGTRMILPEHAGVANAIGAVVGLVTQRATGLVSSPGEGRFTAHFPGGLQHFPDRDAALDAMETALVAEARARAQRAGVEDGGDDAAGHQNGAGGALRITTRRDIREAVVEGRAMFIEATLTATAAGRPRIARGSTRDGTRDGAAGTAR
jgi:hypothetical protein